VTTWEGFCSVYARKHCVCIASWVSVFPIDRESYALVSMGLVSFTAAAQFAPAILLGIYWKGASRRGALAGLAGGFAVWIYTLLLPSFARSGWIPMSFVEPGPFGISLLGPYHLFNLSNLIPLRMLYSGGMLLISVSWWRITVWKQEALINCRLPCRGCIQEEGSDTEGARLWHGKTRVSDLKVLSPV